MQNLGIYIAIPFTFKSPYKGLIGRAHEWHVKRKRFNQATEYAARMVALGYTVYSPLYCEHIDSL
jgi:hypothetical protein